MCSQCAKRSRAVGLVKKCQITLSACGGDASAMANTASAALFHAK